MTTAPQPARRSDETTTTISTIKKEKSSNQQRRRRQKREKNIRHLERQIRAQLEEEALLNAKNEAGLNGTTFNDDDSFTTITTISPEMIKVNSVLALMQYTL
jgi:hypothetical protein